MKTVLFSSLLLIIFTTFTAAGSFTDSGNGTVTDSVTNLMWQKQDDATGRTWEQAISYCEALSLGGFVDWRLPNVKELRSIVDSTKASIPLINIDYFPGTLSSSYWTSTSSAPNPSYAWTVNFSNGSVGVSHPKTDSVSVRCVR